MSLNIVFPEKKDQRRANFLIRNFSSLKEFIHPRTKEDFVELSKGRRFDRFHSIGNQQYYPTDKGWEFFVDFIRTMHQAEPFASRSTIDEMLGAYSDAFAGLKAQNLTPENFADFTSCLPEKFLLDIQGRSERSCVKLLGIDIVFEGAFRIGPCWLTRFQNLDFDFLDKVNNTMVLDDDFVFKGGSAVLITDRVFGTARYCKRASRHHYFTAVSILAVLMNMTFQDCFHRLRFIKLFDEPSQGVSQHGQFSMVYPGGNKRPNLQENLSFSSNDLLIDNNRIAEWYSSYPLERLNQIVSMRSQSRSDLERRLVAALIHFDLARQQRTNEIQFLLLWTSVEAFFSAGNAEIIRVNTDGLIAITMAYLRKELWPDGAKTQEQLRKKVKTYYKYRSKISHHGKIGDVEWRDVQNFSLMVCNLILAVAVMSESRCSTTTQLSQMARRYLKEN